MSFRKNEINSFDYSEYKVEAGKRDIEFGYYSKTVGSGIDIATEYVPAARFKDLHTRIPMGASTVPDQALYKSNSIVIEDKLDDFQYYSDNSCLIIPLDNTDSFEAVEIALALHDLKNEYLVLNDELYHDLKYEMYHKRIENDLIDDVIRSIPSEYELDYLRDILVEDSEVKRMIFDYCASYGEAYLNDTEKSEVIEFIRDKYIKPIKSEIWDKVLEKTESLDKSGLIRDRLARALKDANDPGKGGVIWAIAQHWGNNNLVKEIIETEIEATKKMI